MEKFILESNKWLLLFAVVICLACTSKKDVQVPQDIIVKSTGYTVRKFKRYLYPKIYLLKNEFTAGAKTVMIDDITLKLIEEKAIKSAEVSTIEIYKFDRKTNGDIQIELVLMPRKQYIRFDFKKSDRATWELKKVTPWQD